MTIRPAANAWKRPSRVIDTELADVSVRPARLDRPLRRTSLDPTYSDPHLEELVRVAADRARHEARAEGYAAGWSQGRQAAAVKAAEESAVVAKQADVDRTATTRKLQGLMTSLSEAARAARVTVAPDWTEVSDTLAEGALRLAAAALGRELRSIDDAVVQAVKGALQRLAEPGEAVIHLNPADAALVLDHETLGVRVISDPRVPVGSVTALTPAQRLRHDLPAALDAAEAVLKA
jgi:flagellar biosynthesis/type III secretory pathway protein FliH